MAERLSYFPEIYPGEALYSVLARYHAHSGNLTVRQTNLELFGRYAIRSTFDLPNYLKDLAGRIPADRALSSGELARRFTHINYYTAFLPAPAGQAAKKMQLSGHPNLHIHLGINSSIVRRKEQLSFCLCCCDEMEASKGELWWRLDHQLPGVVVCPTHGMILRQSSVNLWSAGAHGFVRASRSTCSPHAAPLIEPQNEMVHRRLAELAERSSDVLLAPPQLFRSFAELTDDYRDQLWSADFMLSKSQLSVNLLIDAFRTKMGGVLDALHATFGRETTPGAWVLEIARKQTTIKHPLQHLIFRMFLESEPKRNSRFGAGPWPCPNKVANHPPGAPTVANVIEKRANGGVTGTFICPCGYSYTMSALDDGRMCGPRFKEFGPSLDPALQQLVRDGCTLRGAAKALGLHPRGVAAAAKRLGLGVTWKTKANTGPRLGQAHHPARKSRRRPIRKRMPGPAKVRIDWAALDSQISAEIPRIAEQILVVEPPLKLTRLEIERRLKGPNYLSLRREKLVTSTRVAESLMESTEAFQLRRLKYAVKQACLSGATLVPSPLLKAASLHAEWRPVVLKLIRDLPARL